MKLPNINIGDDLRVSLEVLDNGSIRVTLEKREQTRSWEPSNFKWLRCKNGYTVKRPGFLEKLLGRTFQDKVCLAIKKCRKAGLRMREARNVVQKLTPKETRECKINDLVADIAASLKERLLGDPDFQFTDQNEINIQRSARACGPNIYSSLSNAANSTGTEEEQAINDPRRAVNMMVSMMLGGQGLEGVELIEPSEEPTEEPPAQEETPPDRIGELILHEEDKDEEENNNN